LEIDTIAGKARNHHRYRLARQQRWRKFGGDPQPVDLEQVRQSVRRQYDRPNDVARVQPRRERVGVGGERRKFLGDDRREVGRASATTTPFSRHSAPGDQAEKSTMCG
jgi:hypothetical protein